jgi:hypothetical protein
MNHTTPDASAGQSFSCQVCSQLVKIPPAERASAAPAPPAEVPRTSPPRLRDDGADDRGPRARRDDRDRDYRDRDEDDRDYRDRDYRRTRRDRGDVHRRRNFTDNALLCMVMYVLLYPIGFVLNLAYLGEARAYQRLTGEQPEGRGCLLALLIVCFFVPLGIGVLAIGGCIVAESVAPPTYTSVGTAKQTWTPPPRVGPSKGPLPIQVAFRKNAAFLTNNDNRRMHITIVARNEDLDWEQVMERDLDPFASVEIPSTEWFFEEGETIKFWNKDYDLLEWKVP